MAEQRVLSNGKKSSVLQDAAALTTQLRRPGKDRACDEKPDVAARRSNRSWPPLQRASPHASSVQAWATRASLHGGERVGRQASDCVGSHRHARTEAAGFDGVET